MRTCEVITFCFCYRIFLKRFISFSCIFLDLLVCLFKAVSFELDFDLLRTIRFHVKFIDLTRNDYKHMYSLKIRFEDKSKLKKNLVYDKKNPKTW